MKYFFHLLSQTALLIVLAVLGLLFIIISDPVMYTIGVPVKVLRNTYLHYVQPAPPLMVISHVIFGVVAFFGVLFFCLIRFHKGFVISIILAFFTSFLVANTQLLIYSLLIFPLNANIKGYDACMDIHNEILSTYKIDDSAFYANDPLNKSYGDYGLLEDFTNQYGKYNYDNFDSTKHRRYSFARVESSRDLRMTYCDLIVDNKTIISAGDFTVRIW